MGNKYSHALVVEDLSWQPTWAHFEAVHAVLQTFKLAKKTGFEVFDLDADDIVTPKKAAKVMPANMMAMFGPIRGKVVADVMGPSRSERAAAEREIETLMVLLGVDFRVIGDRKYAVKIATPPKDGKTAVKATASKDPTYPTFYKASWTTTPPVAKASGAWPGVWRSGIVFDCAEDQPAFAKTAGPLPAKGFRAALEKALGTGVVEHGWQH